jgi:hypothetical protein
MLVLMLLLLGVLCGYGQRKDAIIKSIRESFEKINTNKELKSITVEDALETSTDGGNSITAYFSGDTIWKITEWVGLSNCVRQYDFYDDGDHHPVRNRTGLSGR